MKYNRRYLISDAQLISGITLVRYVKKKTDWKTKLFKRVCEQVNRMVKNRCCLRNVFFSVCINVIYGILDL